MNGELVTTSEAAKMLGITRRRVSYMIREGKLRATRLASGAMVLRKSDVKLFRVSYRPTPAAK